ncbi:MAG: hypothetical protein M1820_010493 [Bogoriella megaspora]|nr:MAG: hypothetical protein M1820_010493 [Bogoriella megaspora]
MNNEQFRRLVSDTPARPRDGADSSPGTGPRSLGSKARSSILMTPRQVRGSGGVDFVRQLAERDAKPAKQWRSSLPKGTKLPAGYVDRTKERINEEEDERAKRIKALEEQLKLGQIDQALFEKLRDEIVGGDLESTHLVKGLDRKLLERIRRGEDVTKISATAEGTEKSPPPDIDEELDELEQKDIVPVLKVKVIKKGEMAPPPPVAGVKRSRDDILAELKASRAAAAEKKLAVKPSLGPKFKKVVDAKETSWLEHDDKGREVLVVLDEDGKLKRKVRKVKETKDEPKQSDSLRLLDPQSEELLKSVKLPDKPEEEEEDDDIFQGIGDDYDPLAGLSDDEDESSKSGDEKHKPSDVSEPASTKLMPPPPLPSAARKTRNYFANTEPTSEPDKPSNPMQDPTILAALKKVRNIKPIDDDDDKAADGDAGSPKGDGDPERKARLRAMLSSSDRDLEDMDMGFGSSRFDDADEAEDDGRVKLSKWTDNAGGEDDDDGGERGGKKRKRGSKKKKGDKNNAADVMKVIEGQRKK